MTLVGAPAPALASTACVAKLTVRTQDGKSAVFYISEDKSEKPTRHIYYARMDPSPIVFQISELFVESLRMLGSF